MTRALLDQLRERAARAVEMAKLKGADTAYAYLSQSDEFEVEVRQGSIENLSEAQSFSVSLTLSRAGKRATVQSCEMNDESLEELCNQGLSLCRYTDEDRFYSLPDPELLIKEAPELDDLDLSLTEFTTKDRIEMARNLEREMLARDSRLHSDGASFSSLTGSSALANSNGLLVAHSSSQVGLSVSGFADDPGLSTEDLNSGRKQNGGWSSRAHHLTDLDPSEKIARIAANNVLRKLGARKPKSGKYPIYFEPATARTLWGHLLQAMMGSSIYRHESYLQDRLEQQIAHPSLSLIDAPLIPRGIHSRAFDDEGVACRQMDLVRDGVLKTYLLSTYSANKLGMKSTGHAGGYGNILIQPGPHSEAEMLQAMGTGIWIISMMGQGVNISTGDFSRGALGIWVENGQAQFPLMEFTINSNLNEMFRNISMIGNNVEEKWSLRTPGILIGEMAISGLD